MPYVPAPGHENRFPGRGPFGRWPSQWNLWGPTYVESDFKLLQRTSVWCTPAHEGGRRAQLVQQGVPFRDVGRCLFNIHSLAPWLTRLEFRYPATYPISYYTMLDYTTYYMMLYSTIPWLPFGLWFPEFPKEVDFRSEAKARSLPWSVTAASQYQDVNEVCMEYACP